MNKRKFFRWLKIVLMIYGLFGIAVYYLQDHIFLKPVKVSRDSIWSFTAAYKELNIPYSDKTNINIVQFTADRPKGVVLYLHGNQENIAYYAKYATAFTHAGYEVWMMDYPGFGKSTGECTEARMEAYAEQLYILARSRFAADSIVLWGKSLGTGIAAWVAGKHTCKKLVLETPYYSFTSVAARFFPIYPVERMIHLKIPTYTYLQEVKAPVVILHGTSDRLILYSNAERLKPFLKPGDRFVTIGGGAHGNLSEFPAYGNLIDSL